MRRRLTFGCIDLAHIDKLKRYGFGQFLSVPLAPAGPPDLNRAKAQGKLCLGLCGRG